MAESIFEDRSKSTTESRFEQSETVRSTLELVRHEIILVEFVELELLECPRSGTLFTESSKRERLQVRRQRFAFAEKNSRVEMIRECNLSNCCTFEHSENRNFRTLQNFIESARGDLEPQSNLGSFKKLLPKQWLGNRIPELEAEIDLELKLDADLKVLRSLNNSIRNNLKTFENQFSRKYKFHRATLESRVCTFRNRPVRTKELRTTISSAPRH